MLFGSKRAYLKKKRERAEDDDVEVIDEAELEAGLASQVAASASQVAASAHTSGSGRGFMSGLRSMFGGGRSRAAAAPAPPVPRPTARRTFARRVDTNVVSLQLGSIVEDVSIATGDAIFCVKPECHVALSSLSRVYDHLGKQVHGPAPPPVAPAGTLEASGAPAPPPTDILEDMSAGAPAIPEGSGAPAPAPPAVPAVGTAPASVGTAPASVAAVGTAPAPVAAADPLPDVADGQMLWTCEFCGTHNVLTGTDVDELPTEASVDYIEAAAPSAGVAGGAGGTPSAGADTSLMVFVLDTSGSMCVTTEVEGKIALKGDRTADMAKLRQAGDGDQRLPGQKQNVTFVSRLQSLQAAVSQQLATLKTAYPDRPVALVTFASDVTIHGDATSTPVVIAGDRLGDYEGLVTTGTEYSLDSSVGATADGLASRVFELTEGGQTALGPALVVGVAMAARARGSKVVLCTDGLANVGLGSLEAEDGTAEAFYKRIGDFAAERGVMIDVTGIEGGDCNLEALSAMPEITGGELQHVNPLELTKEFSSILANPVIATNVSVTCVLHKALQIANEDGVAGGVLVKDVGNATSDTTISFEYSQKPDVDVTGLSSLPFQSQLRFTKLDGMRVVRVITHSQDVTDNREEAEAMLVNDVMAQHAAQAVAGLARRGSYTSCRVAAAGYNRLLQRNVRTEDDRRGYAAWAADVVELDSALATEEREEAVMGLDAERMDASTRSAMRKQRRGKKDKLASRIHGLSKAAKKKY